MIQFANLELSGINNFVSMNSKWKSRIESNCNSNFQEFETV